MAKAHAKSKIHNGEFSLDEVVLSSLCDWTKNGHALMSASLKKAKFTAGFVSTKINEE